MGYLMVLDMTRMKSRAETSDTKSYYADGNRKPFGGTCTVLMST